MAATGAGDAFGIEPGGDFPGRHTVGIFLEDALYDRGLFEINLAFSGCYCAIVFKGANDLVAKTVAARDFAGFHTTSLAAPGFNSEVF
ncbi:MAG: hypothetical protein HOF30_06925 [Rhodospirillaceae bacterium]|nr:hypothetical protein [Rhodospirillaceae bacterium]MBT5035354.1 hypothetical protein [Rhodospirillaceae bacterium]MBT7771889.1 hypothetical protein [Rhodospirillales bacterium]